MPYTTYKGENSIATWFGFITNPTASQIENTEYTFKKFTPNTDWEKVFYMGSKINRNLKLKEDDVTKEIKAYRYKKQK